MKTHQNHHGNPPEEHRPHPAAAGAQGCDAASRCLKRHGPSRPVDVCWLEKTPDVSRTNGYIIDIIYIYMIYLSSIYHLSSS